MNISLICKPRIKICNSELMTYWLNLKENRFLIKIFDKIFQISSYKFQKNENSITWISEFCRIKLSRKEMIGSKHQMRSNRFLS